MMKGLSVERRRWIGFRLWLRSVIGSMSGRLEAIISYGTTSYPPEQRALLRIINVVSYLIAIFTISYAVQHLFINPAIYWPIMVINFGLFLVALAVPFMHRFHVIAGGLLIAVSEYIGLFALTAIVGRDSGIHLQYIAGAAVPFFIFGLTRMRIVVAFVLFGLILHISAWFMFPREAALIPYQADVIDPIYVTAAVTTIGLIAATVYYAYRAVQRAQAQVQSLLRNILPETIVERLKNHPHRIIADEFSEATVLFADLVGFTPLSKQLGAAKTVNMLNDIITRLDRVVERAGVEKIKTIGDAYMAASGVPVPDPRHCHQLAEVALEIREIVRSTASERGFELDVRVGMASGPVTAGIIGKQKFAYDIWGDTVNLASRMESHGKVGEIVVSPDVKERLANEYNFTSLGVREIKGIGPLETFALSR